jgi:hypothetical protein
MKNLSEYYTKIKSNIEKNKEEYVLSMQKTLNIPFSKDTDHLLFYYQVEIPEIQHIEVMAMDAHGGRIEKDANGNDIEVIFGCDPYDGLTIQWNEEEPDYDEELAMKLQQFAKEKLAVLLAEAFDQVKNNSLKLPCYFYDDVESDAYDLRNKRWIDAF